VRVVITGGTRGFGRGLAAALLERDAKVFVCGRSQASVDDADAAGIPGTTADVARHEDLERLWEEASRRLGGVDVFINNAGTSNVQRDFPDLDASTLGAVMQANLLGTMNGVHVALRRMREQGHGHVYTMEGFGSDGATQRGMSVYGATKRAIRYLTRSVVRETRGGPVKVGSLSPGVVVTDLLLRVYREGDPDNWRRQRWLFKFIADPVEPVAAWMARRILASPRHGAHLAWMTVPKAALRVLDPRYHRRDLFAALGE